MNITTFPSSFRPLPWLLITVLVFSFVTSVRAQVALPVNIGVLQEPGMASAEAGWQPLASYLNRTIPGREFHIIPLSSVTVSPAVAGGEVDFVVASPTVYLALEVMFGMTRLATWTRRLGKRKVDYTGAVIFVRSERKDINALSDLRGVSVAAMDPIAYDSGWILAWREFHNAGINIKKDFPALKFFGADASRIVASVLDGSIDVGVVPLGAMETLVHSNHLDTARIKVLNPTQYTDVPFKSSTPLYPQWSIAVAHYRDPELVQDVLVALMQLEEGAVELTAAGIAGWTVPAMHEPVRQLLRDLRLDPYRKMDVLDATDFAFNHRYLLLLGIAISGLLVVTNIFVLWLNAQLSKSKLQLESEIRERRGAQEQSNTQAARTQALYQASSQPGISNNDHMVELLKVGCTIFEMDFARICEVDESEDTLTVRWMFAPARGETLEVHTATFSTSPSATSYLENSAVCITHFGGHTLDDQVVSNDQELGVFISAPVSVTQRKHGTIDFLRFGKGETKINQADLDFLELMGRWVGVSWERQKALEDAERARATAEAASAAKSQFLANMSHELRTPLNAIIGYSELLISDAVEAKSRQFVPDLDRIRIAGKHLLGLISEVLDLSKIEAGKMDRVIEAFDVSGIVDTAVATVTPIAIKNGNEIQVEYGSNVGKMLSDRTKVQQILVNLLGNAAKFTQNGKIVVSVERREVDGRGWIELTVRDTGIGIPSEQLDKLFRPFTQVDPSATRRYGGSGLGLVICKHFAQILDGDISVESHEGKGSTFCVKLPERLLTASPDRIETSKPIVAYSEAKVEPSDPQA